MIQNKFEDQLFHLNRIGIALTSILDLDQLLDVIVSSARELTHSDAGSLYIKQGNQLMFVIAQNNTLAKKLGEEKVKEFFKPFALSFSSKSLAGHVATTGKTLNIQDVDTISSETGFEFFEKPSLHANYEIKSMLLAPMKNPEQKVLGVLQLINAQDDNGNIIPFDERYEFFINSLASQAAIAIENASLSRQLQNAQLDTIFRLSMAAEFRESGDPLHICRISEYSVAISEGMNLAKEKTDLIRVAAPLHDIGKMGLPDYVLKKSGVMNQDELAIMQEHVYIGAKILAGSQSEILRMAEKIVLTHHEKYNGSGYPKGLKGKEIPVEGKIVALSDTIDSMTMPASYKSTSNFDEVSKEIVAQSGEQFDPEVVNSFLDQKQRFKQIYENWRFFGNNNINHDWDFIYNWWKKQFP